MRWWLLGEDPGHERLALELARSIGLNKRPVNVTIAPSGEGAASAFVLKRYAREVRATTRRRPGERVAILVMIDGDNLGLSRRKQQLDEALREAGEPTRAADEPVVILVPTWSIETWLLPQSAEVTEAVDLKPQMRDPQTKHFEEAARRIVRPDDDEPLASVRDATREVARLPK
ncbi:MAG: hypothetical protein Q8K32_36665 [Archangium sp.]|nr:hypothetical protein [Archangium sp.]